MLLVNEDNLKVRFLGNTGLVTFEKNGDVYLSDSRTHIFSLMFPPITFIVPLKVYKISDECSGGDNNQLLKRVSIPWGLMITGTFVGNILGNYNFNLNMAFNKYIMILGAFLIYISKYVFHFYNLRMFEKKNHIKLSKTRVYKLRMKYVNREDQNRYYLFVLGAYSFCLSLDLFFGLMAYFTGNWILTIGFFLAWGIHTYSANITRIKKGKKYLVIK